MKFGVFVPAYNEEKIIEKNVYKILGVFEKLGTPVELYLVDDNSVDQTPVILKRIESKTKNVHHLRFSNGPSRRENLGKAMSQAKEEYIMFMDMDLATDIKFVQDLVGNLKKGYDVVFGSRYAKGANTKRKFTRLIISKCYNTFMQIYFGSKVLDHQCGFKGFKKSAFQKIYSLLKYDKSFNRGWFWDVEVLVWAQKLKLKIKEFPINWSPGEQSSFNVKREIRMIPYVLTKLPKKIRRNKKKIKHLRKITSHAHPVSSSEQVPTAAVMEFK